MQTHPDVLGHSARSSQMMMKVDQVRRVIESIYFRPQEARERVYIFTDSAFIKEAANSLLKVWKSRPSSGQFFLLTDNAGELLPTIRSRSAMYTLSALPTAEIEEHLAKTQPNWNAKQRDWWRVSRKAQWAAPSI